MFKNGYRSVLHLNGKQSGCEFTQKCSFPNCNTIYAVNRDVYPLFVV